LRRIAHFDYWQEKVRTSILLDAAADLLLYGNAERAVVEVAHRIASGEPVSQITDVRGTAFIRRDTPQGWMEIDSSRIDQPGKSLDRDTTVIRLPHPLPRQPRAALGNQPRQRPRLGAKTRQH